MGDDPKYLQGNFMDFFHSIDTQKDGPWKKGGLRLKIWQFLVSKSKKGFLRWSHGIPTKKIPCTLHFLDTAPAPGISQDRVHQAIKQSSNQSDPIKSNPIQSNPSNNQIKSNQIKSNQINQIKNWQLAAFLAEGQRIRAHPQTK